MSRSLPAFIGLRYAGSRRRSGLVSFISGLSIAGLTVGVGLLLVVLSVMNGFDRELRERILAILPQAAIYHRYGIEDWQALRDELLSHDGVTGVAPFVELQGMLSHRKDTAPVVIYGIEPELEAQVSALQSTIAPSDWTALQQQDGLLLGKGVADTLDVKIGDSVTLIIPDKREPRRLPRFKVVSVLAIVETKTELDHSLALSSLGFAAALTDAPNSVTGLRLKFNDLFAAPEMTYELLQQLPYGFYGRDWTRSHGNLYAAVQMSKRMVGLLLFMIVAIAAFNVVSTLVMVVVDKQGDIAILRTLGASRGEIMRVFMWQGVVIGSLGTGLGLVLGVAGSLSVKSVVSWLESLLGIQFLKSDVYPITYVPSEMLWQDFVLVGVVALGLSFLATLYPAMRAARVEPAEALRHE